MNPDEPSTPAPVPQAGFRAIVVAVALLAPLAWVALSQQSHPGGGALDATGVLVLRALVPGTLVGLLVGAGLSQLPRSVGWGLVLGLFGGALAVLLATAAAFVAMLGG